MAMSANANMISYVIQPDENEKNEDEDMNNEEEEEEEETNEEVFESLNAQLDQLDSVLDSLERKNDNIHAELVELLETNRKTREQFKNLMQNQDSPGKEA